MGIDMDIQIGDPKLPILAVAVHDGHQLRQEIADRSALDDLARLREEDPFTGRWTEISANRIIVRTSRFEVDLNRAKHEAVYIKPEDAWGLDLWKNPPDFEIIKRSLAAYDDFYKRVEDIFDVFHRQFKKIIVFDLHAYNHLRSGPKGPPARSEENPEVNLGTKTMDRQFWAPVVERFLFDLRRFDYLGRRLDVRENVKFYGRQFAQWTHGRYPGSACVLSVEFKKIFMDEWTGIPDERQLVAIKDALQSTIPGILSALHQ